MSPAHRAGAPGWSARGGGKRSVVTLYVTADCHLCEEANRLLRRLARQMRFRLELVDISSDPVLYQRFSLTVPVLAVEGEAVLSAPLDEGRVREALGQRWPSQGVGHPAG